MGNKRNGRCGRRKLGKNTALRKIFKRGVGGPKKRNLKHENSLLQDGNGISQDLTTQHVVLLENPGTNVIDSRPRAGPGITERRRQTGTSGIEQERVSSSHNSQSEFEPIIDIKIDPGTFVPIGSSDEIENAQFGYEKSAEEVNSILDLINWLDSCGTILIKETDADHIRNQIYRFYSQFVKGPPHHSAQSATSTHNMRQRKIWPTTKASNATRDNFERGLQISNNVSKSEGLKKNNASKSKKAENSEGLNADWTSFIPTIKHDITYGSIAMEEFRNQDGDIVHLLSPPNFDVPLDVSDTGDQDSAVKVNPIPVPIKKKRVYQKRMQKWCGKDVCDQCGKVFFRKDSLARHLETHADLKNHVCEVCGRGFNRASYLKLHLRVHEEGRKYLCDQCPKAYFHYNHLTTHQLNHIGEKKHVCHVCNRAFMTPHYLKDHLLTHSVERDFKCTYCHKAFRRPDHLRAHVRIHTGDKRYKCEPCGKAFVQIGSLIFHNRTHHGIVKEKEQLV